jgi:predicted short-subunit dehydrogenase-like oxidoreductase (DUF2520 family)
MIKVVILGNGNVAFHLFQSFTQSHEVEVVQVFSRKYSEDFPVELQVHDFSKITAADIYIISVSDDAIEEVSNLLLFNDKLVIHTSGSTDFKAINAKNRRGVFYPLQTFSKNKAISFKNIPICLEVEERNDLELLKKVANAIADNVYEINGQQRKALHVSAVFVCNFVNHLYNIGNKICAENKIPFQILKPLIEETAQKIKALSPKDAQTGPAIRKDQNTIEKHIDFLDNENQKNIYNTLTQAIQNE